MSNLSRREQRSYISLKASLRDVFSYISSVHYNGCLSMMTQTDEPAMLCFSDRKLTHAQFKELSGEAALELMRKEPAWKFKFNKEAKPDGEVLSMSFEEFCQVVEKLTDDADDVACDEKEKVGPAAEIPLQSEVEPVEENKQTGSMISIEDESEVKQEIESEAVVNEDVSSDEISENTEQPLQPVVTADEIIQAETVVGEEKSIQGKTGPAEVVADQAAATSGESMPGELSGTEKQADNEKIQELKKVLASHLGNDQDVECASLIMNKEHISIKGPGHKIRHDIALSDSWNEFFVGQTNAMENLQQTMNETDNIGNLKQTIITTELGKVLIVNHYQPDFHLAVLITADTNPAFLLVGIGDLMTEIKTLLE